MLPEIAAQVLLFLTRRDLDKASAVSMWLDALIAQSCNVYPLRLVTKISLHPSRHGNDFVVAIEKWSSRPVFAFYLMPREPPTEQSFISMDEAMHFVGSIIRHSYVDSIELGDYFGSMMALFPRRWTTLVDAISAGSVRWLQFNSLDLSALDDDVFLAAVACSDLRGLEVKRSVIPSDFATDALIRSSAAKDLLKLWSFDNKGDTPQRLSEDAVLDFILSDLASGRSSLSLVLEGTGITDMFLTKFFE